MTERSTERIFMTGGTGFVGSRILQHLGEHPVRLLARNPEEANAAGAHVDVVEGDVTDRESLRGTMDGCDTVVHLVAIIEESGGATFDSVIRQGTANVVDEARQAGVQHFVHMSALGAHDDPALAYTHAKWQSEQIVIESGLRYTIFRPSVIFGPEDGFINALAGVVRNFPVTPVVGDGSSRFQPVHIDEVARAYARAVDDPAATAGTIHELGGAKIYTYEEMLDVIARKLGKSRPKIHVPVGLMQVVVSMSKPLPRALRPPVTSEQLKMLALDNTTQDSATARLINGTPRALEDDIEYLR